MTSQFVASLCKGLECFSHRLSIHNVCATLQMQNVLCTVSSEFNDRKEQEVKGTKGRQEHSTAVTERFKLWTKCTDSWEY